MDLDNESLDKQRGRKEMHRLMNYYINTNNIAYFDNLEENDDQVSNNESRKR